MRNNGRRPTLVSMTPNMRRTYWVWASMIQRCHNPRNHGYQRYGGRGIRVCSEWLVFDRFLADMGLPQPGESLDRINNDVDYSRLNCRWATRLTQNNNRPSWCFALEVNGVAMTLKEAWRLVSPLGLTYRSVHKRIAERAWPISMALVLGPNEKR